MGTDTEIIYVVKGDFPLAYYPGGTNPEIVGILSCLYRSYTPVRGCGSRGGGGEGDRLL